MLLRNSFKGLLRQGLLCRRSYSHYIDPAEQKTRRPKVTIPQLHKLYKEKKPISFITAHDYISGVLADRAEVDAVLVGDSLAMVCLGYSVSKSLITP